MRINHNLAALNTFNRMSANQSFASKSMERLSSGQRINRASDDAAGLAISEKMRSQIRGLNQAERNAQDSISLLQTAEGGLNEVHSVLQRMRELAVQSANDGNTDTDRAKLQEEVNELAKEITRISNDTEFNNKKLLNGSQDSTNTTNFTAATGLTFHIGANSGQNITTDIGSFDAFTLGVDDAGGAVATDSGGATATGGINISTQTTADAAIDTITTAIETVSTARSSIGATQNRLEHTINNLNTSAENLTAAESRIRDVDMAKEMMEFTKNNILTQASQAMLAQSNQMPQGVLQLLR
ncbi:flagellin Hag [Pseudalkalibacillus caeni]|uniref:Flagellin n=1 Tax=Exobacillus caeni TaxID=2574798 RepID=A0A5R9EZ91_9BACL|nr:flagellin Hag [Pseudalkalibacillus caeni]TLS36612.1 flagellin [Pseudalkalibacillus caeni]